MKMKLNAALRAALLACYAIAAPIATTVSTGAFIAGTAALMTNNAKADVIVSAFSSTEFYSSFYNLTDGAVAS